MLVVALLLCLMSFSLFISAVKKVRRGDRRVLVCLTFVFYAFLIIAEQFYLENVYGMHFNLSDSTNYYLQTKDISFEQLVENMSVDDGRSNSFYYLLNWAYQSGFSEPAIYGVALKLTNAIFFLLAYLMFTRNSSEKVGLMDYLVLFHPWLIMLVIRNVRDAYIIYFMSLFIGLSFKEKFSSIDASVASLYSRLNRSLGAKEIGDLSNRANEKVVDVCIPRAMVGAKPSGSYTKNHVLFRTTHARYAPLVTNRVSALELLSVSAILCLMYFSRPLFIVPLLMIYFVRLYYIAGLRQRFALVIASTILLLIVGYANFDEMRVKAVSGFLGNAVFFGVESQEDVDPLFYAAQTGSINTELKSMFVQKMATSFPVFLFTPHPYNWADKYSNFSKDGIYVIYTDADNWLIILGAVLNYLLVYPLLFKYLHNIREVNLKWVIAPLFIMLMYSIFLLGNADMRIRYTFIFFLVMGFYMSGLTLYKSRSDFKYLFLSLGVLFTIPFVSNS